MTNGLAQFWAWTPSLASPSWRTVFRFRSEDGSVDAGCGYDPSLVPDPGPCDQSPEDAYACTESQKPECLESGPFVLDTEQVVEFWIGDYALTDNGGGVSLLLTADPTGVEAEEDAGFAPVVTVFPNPSPASSTLSLNLPRLGAVTVVVFDVRGRSVRRLDLGRLATGSYRVSWDGLDESGSRVSSGVYFFEVDVDGERLGARSMVIER